MSAATRSRTAYIQHYKAPIHIIQASEKLNLPLSLQEGASLAWIMRVFALHGILGFLVLGNSYLPTHTFSDFENWLMSLK